MISRRHFLGQMAAAAVFPLCGCDIRGHLDKSSLDAIPGRILGASFKQGHLLRTPASLPRFQKPRRKVGVAILGGGVAGLSAAWKLLRSGIDDFHVFELEKEAGGNSRCHRYPESKAPWGAHYLPVPTQEATAVREVLSEMGLLDGYAPDGSPRYSELELCHEPQERIYTSAGWEEGIFPRSGATREDLKQLDAFHLHIEHWKNWRDSSGRKAFAIPLELSSPDPQLLSLDRQSMAEYMTAQGWTSQRLRDYVEYGCRDDYGTALETTSAWAGLHYFASRDGGGFLPRESQFVWPEGNQRLVQHYLDAVGPQRVSSGQLITRVEVSPEGVVIDILDTESGDMHGYVAEHCIYALPTFLRPFVLREPVRPGFTYAPWVVANLVLDHLPRDLPKNRTRLCWDNVIAGSQSLGYVVATHQDLRTRPIPLESDGEGGGGEDATVLTWYRPFSGADPRTERETILARSWESWRDEILGELAPIHSGIEKSVRRLDVMLLGHAMIRPTVGFIWGQERAEANRARPPLYFAHSDLSGISIFEQAQYQGVLAAQQLMADLAHPFHDSLV